jgi:gamma-glutamylputrescine oxidase
LRFNDLLPIVFKKTLEKNQTQTMLDSIYADNLYPLPPEQIAGTQSCDIAIIGGGLTGVTAALHLAENGYEVVLLEAGMIGRGGSGRNGGHLCQGWPNDFHHISKQLNPHDASLAWKAGMAAVDMVSARIKKHKIDCDVQFGYLNAALHPRQMKGLLEMQEEWSHRGYTHFTALEDSHALAPYINSDAYCGGLYDAGSGQIQPLKYLHGLALAARKAGVRIFQESCVIQIEKGAKKTLSIEGGQRVIASKVLLCGNAYLSQIDLAQIGLSEMRSKLAKVTSSVLATKPLSENLVRHILPSRAAVADCNTALNYFRIDSDNRMIFGGRASYTNVNLGNVETDLRQRMVKVFPVLDSIETKRVWSGQIGITVNRIPHFGRTNDDIYFVQGFSGHGVALTGLAGTILADAVMGDAERFDVMQSLRHLPFPGGIFRMPALALGMTWHKLRDRLKL